MPLTTQQAYELLDSAQQRNRLGHAFLITGKSGVGKRDLAKRIIQLLNQPKEKGSDLFGLESSPSPISQDKPLEAMQSEFIRIIRPRSKSRLIKVEEMRELEEFFNMSAPPTQWKIGVLIDVDRMNESASNAFLKTLEEPPKNCLLLLLTTSPDRLLVTILSRCISIPLFNPALTGLSEIQSSINNILKKTFASTPRGLATALSIKNDFDALLKHQKEENAKKHKVALKAEMEALKQVSDRDYMKEKEEEAKAEEASDYLFLRDSSVEALVSWLGDALRWKVGHVPYYFTDSAPLYQQFAHDLSIDQLLQRMKALEELRHLLTDTNVSEALALEVCFMRVFEG